MATSFWARCSAACENIRPPVKRQTMTRLASPSITESRPKPIRAIELAARPATIAIPPSAVIKPSESQESSLTRRARRPYRSRVSRAGWTAPEAAGPGRNSVLAMLAKAILILGLPLLVAGCGGNDGGGGRKIIVAGFYPLAYAAE